jgi:hypothetical protein
MQFFPPSARIKGHKLNFMKNDRITGLALTATEKVYLILYNPGGISDLVIEKSVKEQRLNLTYK